MPVDMEQEGAQRVSAPVTVRSASTPLDRLLLVQHRLIASRVTLEDMEQVAAKQASVPEPVRLAGTPLGQLLLGPPPPTALLVRMASTLGHTVATRLRTARTVYLGLQTWTTILQQLVRRAPLDSSLVWVPLSVHHVRQVRLTRTVTRLPPATLAQVAASHLQDQFHAMSARVEKQIPTPRPPLSV